MDRRRNFQPYADSYLETQGISSPDTNSVSQSVALMSRLSAEDSLNNSRAHTNGDVQQRTLLRRVLRRVLETAFERALRRVLGRCLAVGFNGKKGS